MVSDNYGNNLIKQTGQLFGFDTQDKNDNSFINTLQNDLLSNNLLKATSSVLPNIDKPQLKDKQNTGTISLSNLNKNPIQNLNSNTSGQSLNNNSNTINNNSTINNTTTTPKPSLNPTITLSSDKDFKIKQDQNKILQEQQQQAKELEKSKQNNILDTAIDSLAKQAQFDFSKYSNQNRAFGETQREFSNHKAAMESKLNLYKDLKDKLETNSNTDFNALIKKHDTIERIVNALETQKQRFGENSKEYKDLEKQMLEYDEIKKHNLTNYKALSDYYQHYNITNEGEEITKPNTNTDTAINTDTNTSKFNSINDFVEQRQANLNVLNENLNKESSNIDRFKNATKDFLFDEFSGAKSTHFQKQESKQGFNADSGFNLLLNGELDKQINTIRENEYKSLDEKDKELSNNSLAQSIDGTNSSIKSLKNSFTFGLDDKVMNLFTSRKNVENLEYFLDYMDKQLSVNEEAKEQFQKYRDTYAKALKENDSTKKEALNSQAKDYLNKAKEAYDKSPAKLLANSSLMELSSIVENEHDTGRLMNLLQSKEVNQRQKQEYLSDFASVLKTNEKFKNLNSLAYTQKGDLIAFFQEGDKEVGYSINPSILSKLLYGIKSSINEIGMGVGGAIAGGIQGAKLGVRGGALGGVAGAVSGSVIGGALGSGLGSLTDSQINAILTGYRNEDLGLKKATESMALSALGDLAIMGIAKVGGKIASKITGTQEALQDTKELKDTILDKAKNLSNHFKGGNIKAGYEILNKHLLDDTERQLARENAQKQIFGEVLSDNTQPYKDLKTQLMQQKGLNRFEAMKKIWEYEKAFKNELNTMSEKKLNEKLKGISQYESTSLDSNRPIMGFMQDLFETKSTRSQRDKILKFAMQDLELSNVVKEVANKNPELAKILSNQIDNRAKAVGNSIISEDFSKEQFNALTKDYEKRVKSFYDTSENSIKEVLKDSNFTHLDTQIIDTLTNLKNEIPRLEHKGLIKDLIDFTKQKGENLNINNLFALRKQINAELRSKELKKPSINALKDINNNIDEAIAKQIEQKALTHDIDSNILENYKRANKEYALFKEFQDTSFYKATRDKKEISQDKFNNEILKQATSTTGFKNQVFNKIAKNTDKNLQAQAIKQVIYNHTQKIKGREAIAWDNLIDDLDKIKHSITDDRLLEHIELLKDLRQFYRNDLSIMQSLQNSLGKGTGMTLASSFLGRVKMALINAMYKITSSFGLSANAANQAFYNHINNALRYAKSFKDLNKAIIDKLDIPEEFSTKESKKALKELQYFESKLDTPPAKAYDNLAKSYINELQAKAHLENLESLHTTLQEQLQDSSLNLIQEELKHYPIVPITHIVVDNSVSKTSKLQRQELKELLKPLLNTPVQNLYTGHIATLSNIGLKKIGSDKAMQKSLDNGFSKNEHFEAAKQILELYKNARFAEKFKDTKKNNESLSIYRYNAPININNQQANALLTLKEYEENGKRLYSIELEGLDAIKFDPSGKDLIEQSSTSIPNNNQVFDQNTATSLASIDNPYLAKNHTIPDNKLTSQDHIIDAEIIENNLLPNVTKKQDLETTKDINTSMSNNQAINAKNDTTNNNLDSTNSNNAKNTINNNNSNTIGNNHNLNNLDKPTIDNTKNMYSLNKNTQSFLINKEILDSLGDDIKAIQDFIEVTPDLAGLGNIRIAAIEARNAYIALKEQENKILQNTKDSLLSIRLDILDETKNLRDEINNALVLLENKIRQDNFHKATKVLPMQDMRENPLALINIIKPHQDTPKEFQNLLHTPIIKSKEADIKAQTPIQAKDTDYKLSPNYSLQDKADIKSLHDSLKILDMIAKNPNLIIADSKGNNLLLTPEGIKAYLLELAKHRANKVLQSHTLPLLEIDTKPIQNKIKALSYNTNKDYKDLQSLQNSYIQNLINAENKALMLKDKNVNNNVNKNLNNPNLDKDLNNANLDKNLNNTNLDTDSNISNLDKDLNTKEQNLNNTNLEKDLNNESKQIPEDLKEAWLQEFNLKDINEDFIPTFSKDIKDILDKAGLSQDFHLKLGSLIKLNAKDRKAFLPYIKDTIQEPNVILNDGQGILFIKEFTDSNKNKYFMSVAKDFNGEWIFSSHTRRELKNIQNKLKVSEILYNKGFKGGEVAGASDILESGGTAIKPSDLQITYPANHSSGKNPLQDSTTPKVNETPKSTNNALTNLESNNKALQEIKSLKYQLIGGLDKIFHNTNISKASLGKYKALKIDNFFNDFDISTLHNAGLTRDYQQRFVGTLKNGKIFEILKHQKFYDPTSPYYTQDTIFFNVANKNGKVEKQLMLQSYKDAYQNQDIKAIITQDGKQKSLDYGINKRSANFSSRDYNIQDEYIKPLQLTDDEFNEFVQLPPNLHNLNERIYRDSVIKDISRPTSEYKYKTMGLEFKTLKEAKAFIDETHTPINTQEAKAITQLNKDAIVSYNRLYQYPKKPKLQDDLQNTILHQKLMNLDFHPHSHTPIHRINEEFSKLNDIIKQSGEPFGINFIIDDEIKNKGEFAINLLLQTKLGQVKNAFYKEGLGDIDLVWGDSKMGLKHILERRTQQYGEEKAINFIHDIPKMIDEAKVYRNLNDRIELVTNKYTIVLGLRGDRKFLLTSLRDSRNPKRMGIAQTGVADDFTDETLGISPLSSNHNNTTTPKVNKQLENEKLSLNLSTTGTQDIKELRQSLKKALNPIKDKDITNKETGIKARISSVGINKISSQKALNKSLNNGYTKEEHYKAGEHIKELFENANLKEMQDDYKKRKQITNVYKFIIPISINNKEANALITMFENNEAGNKIYSLELDGLYKKD